MSSLCHAFGLPVLTEIAIPGAMAAAAGEPAFTVAGGQSAILEHKPNQVQHTDQEKCAGPYRLGPAGFSFTKAGIARFICPLGGERLIVDVVPGAAETDVSAYLIATALPALLWMRGEIVLHGAAAILPGCAEALGLLGVSGSGKSRLLGEIVAAGGTVVAEDSCRMWCDGDRVMAAGLPGLIYRRAEGADLGADRTVYSVPLAQQRVSAGLSAVVVLQPKDDATGGFEYEPIRLRDVSALAAVLRHRHRHRVPDLLGLSAGLLPRLSAMASRVPVYSWEFLQAALRSPGNGGTWRALAGLQTMED